MADFNYLVYVDWGRDGTFGHASANISSYVSEVRCHHGMNQTRQRVASPAECTIRLVDPNSNFLVGLFLAGTFSQLLKRGLLVRVRVTDGATTWTLWEGKIDTVSYSGVSPNQDAVGAFTVTLTCRDPMLELLDAEYFPTLMQGVTTDEPLTALFDSGAIQYPYPGFILDVSELNGTDVLFENTFTNFETGVTTLSYVGDIADAGRGVSAQQYVRDAVEAEIGGRFWWDAPTGKFKFINRHNDPYASTSVIIPFTNLTEANLAYANELTTVVNLSYRPRRVGTAGTVIYTHNSLPYKLAPDESREITARYSTTEGAKIGALTVIPPVAGTDYSAVYYEDGTTLSKGDTAGANAKEATHLVSCYAFPGASSCKLLMRNVHTQDVYLTALQIRGTPLESFASETVTAIDPQANYDYGRIEQTFNIPLLDDAQFAQSAANHLLSKLSDPETRLTSVRWIVTSGTKTYLSRNIGDRITFQQLTPVARYHDSDYILIGVTHSINARDGRHEVTWLLDWHRRQSYFVLNTSKLAPSGANYETVLAF